MERGMLHMLCWRADVAWIKKESPQGITFLERWNADSEADQETIRHAPTSSGNYE
jgi:hypothetical protein